jgi:tetratricopeptide (TPR) repeat protein
MRPYHLARACALARGSVQDAARPWRLAEAELKAHAGAFWSLTARGAGLYRAGQPEQAVPLLEQSLKADGKPGRAVLNWLWLALAKQRQGQTEEARGLLEKARTWLAEQGKGMPPSSEAKLGLDLHNWLEAQVLLREAEALLRGSGKSERAGHAARK